VKRFERTGASATGGKRALKKAHMQPTLLTNLKEENLLRELFGPVASFA
jgi:acyl-CoA reductase-like NAD-dependent aldehyde dehydrogenase